MRVICRLPKTNRVLANFLKHAILAKKPFCPQPPKEHNFSFFKLSFSIFHLFSFAFSNIRKTKTKKCNFSYQKPFLTPQKPAKKIFLHPSAAIWDFENTKPTLQNWDKQKILDQVFTQQLDEFLTQKPPQLDQFWVLQQSET